MLHGNKLLHRFVESWRTNNNLYVNHLVMIKPHQATIFYIYIHKQRRCVLRFVASNKQNEVSKLKLIAELLFFPMSKIYKKRIVI